MSLVLSISFKKKDSFPCVRSFAFAKQRNGERQCSYLKPSMDFISIYNPFITNRMRSFVYTGKDFVGVKTPLNFLSSELSIINSHLMEEY